jgi:hypothetical protein
MRELSEVDHFWPHFAHAKTPSNFAAVPLSPCFMMDPHDGQRAYLTKAPATRSPMKPAAALHAP